MTTQTSVTGPVQMLVVGFQGDNFTGEVMEELRRLKDADLIRLIDLLVVRKRPDGELDVLQTTDLSPEEASDFGATVGALIGLGADGVDGLESGAEAGATALADGHVFGADDVWFVADAIPPGETAAIALLEHRWAIPLRDAIVRAGGSALADEWIHASDLIAVGLDAAAVGQSH